MMKFKLILGLLAALFAFGAVAEEKATIKLGALAFGTMNWELAALKNENLLADAGFNLDIVPLATPQAAKVALQSEAVDMIVSDWIWVSRMRAEGMDYTFYPYSATAGALMVAADSPVKMLADLKGRKLGIAGGELDKNWLLLQALGLEQGIDLNASVEKVFGAPPLLNEQLQQQRIDAVINYWHFAARLEAEGFRQIIDGESMQKQLGIERPMPSLGYVFRGAWADDRRDAVLSFLRLTTEAKNRLCVSDEAWNKIVPLTGSEDAAAQTILRQRYCDGRVKDWDPADLKPAESIYQLLRRLSGNKLTGASEHLQAGTFWKAD